MPENIDECVEEKGFMNYTGYSIGDTITVDAEKIKDDEGNEKDLLKQNTMKIVGIVESPMYISRERGSSKLGEGKVNYYMYILKDSITTNIFTNVYVKAVGANNINCYNQKYEDLVENVKDNIQAISDERREARYKGIYDNINLKIQDAQKELNTAKEKAQKELKSAQNKIYNAKSEVQSAKNLITINREKADKEFQSAQSEIENAQKELSAQIEQFNTAKLETQKQISENKKRLENLRNLQTKYNEETDEQNKRQIEALLASQGITIESLPNVIETMSSQISKAEEELKETENKLNLAQKELQAQTASLQTQKQTTYEKFKTEESKLKTIEATIKQNEQKLKNEKKEADKKIEEADEKLQDAKEKLLDIKKPDWYILDRNQNNGYASYIQDTDRIANIATVFPVVFFLVAALISLTSMSRMVEEERVQIGTLKALGYTKMQIASKYIIYAVLATVVGSVIGLAIGYNLIPKIIINMYAMMYTLPEATLEFNTQYSVISLILALLCTVGATIYSCSKELLSTPANLMRPKAPKPGKRVFLENVKWIWTRLSFTQKVTARNIFRYKKRFLMTIIGVMGCTALILAGFGIRDSISKMIPLQYREIFKYNIQISLNNNMTEKQLQEETERITKIDGIEKTTKINIQAVTITSVANTQNIQLIIPEDVESFKSFISLKSRTQKDENYTLDENGVILTEKLAKLLNLKVGDTIKIKDTEDVEVETKIAHITENYLMHYMYMPPELYQKLYNQEMKSNTLFANTTNEAQEDELGRKILESDNITNVLFTSSTQDVFASVMDNMKYVVWILIISAGLLAFVVLYNLANTNISERIRELATIKVLGFYDKEVYDYVSKESTILTIIGIAIGLFAGYFLAMFIIQTCELDILMFSKEINVSSFVYSVAITILFTIIVNIATYFALKKIDMVESLKSVE